MKKLISAVNKHLYSQQERTISLKNTNLTDLYSKIRYENPEIPNGFTVKNDNGILKIVPNLTGIPIEPGRSLEDMFFKEGVKDWLRAHNDEDNSILTDLRKGTEWDKRWNEYLSNPSYEFMYALLADLVWPRTMHPVVRVLQDIQKQGEWKVVLK